MIRLDSTTRKLQIVLGGAVTTNQLPVIVSYSDKTATAYTGGTQRATTNSTTQVDICAAPAASTVRDIDNLTVWNKDTVTATVTILFDDNGTDAELIKAVLLTNEQLVYTHGSGWKVLDSAGATKTTANTVPTTSAALAAQITDETGSGALVFATSPTLVTPALGTPSSGTVTNLTGTASININGTVGATTPAAGAFTTLSATGNVTLGDASTDTLNVGNGGIVKDASGNVGVGTTTPQSKLAVSNAGVAGMEFFTNYPGGGVGTYIQSYNRSTPGYVSTAYDAADHSFRTASTERMRIDASGNVLVTNAAGLGYGTGAGGAVTQLTSKSTAVTLDKPTGNVVTHAASLAAGARVTFVLNNSLINSTDTMTVNVSNAAASPDEYLVRARIASGAAAISIINQSAGALAEAITINFNLHKGTNA